MEEEEQIRKAGELKEKSQTNVNTNNSNSAVVNNVTNIINNSSQDRMWNITCISIIIS